MEIISDKDTKALINRPNVYLSDFYARVAIYDASPALINFYENNKELIKGKVVVVRSKADEASAARARNTLDKILFIFAEEYWVDSYFTSVSQTISIPKALLNRVRKARKD